MLLEWVTRTRALLELERATEVEESQAFLNASPKLLESRGLCLRNLLVTGFSTGLLGRTIVTFKLPQAELLPTNRFGIGDIVCIWTAESRDTSGVVTRISRSQISVAFENEAVGLLGSALGPHRLLKLANEITFQRYTMALKEIEKMERVGDDRVRAEHVVQLRRIVMGIDAPEEFQVEDRDLEWKNSGLNESQKTAVKFALDAKYLALIHGPPGTGKTTTVCELIHHLVEQGNRVLVLAPSNIAVDNMVEKLVSIPSRKWRLVRIGHPARMLNTIINHSLDYLVYESENAQLARDIRSEISTLLKDLGKKGSDDRSKIKAELSLLRKDLIEREKKSITGILKSSSVILSTAVGAGEKTIWNNWYDVVVIDEAGQALEVESWIGILRASKKVILAGDHMQLPPTVRSSEAEKDGLGISLLEKLATKFPQATCMLDVQYRMNSVIMQWSSYTLYHSKLKASNEVENHTLSELEHVKKGRLTSYPLLVVDTTGCMQTKESEEKTDDDLNLSRRNSGEADIVHKIVLKLYEYGCKSSDIGIITPYRGQVNLLKGKSWPGNIEIGTVDGFQGREKEVVIISLVRSNAEREVGFLREIRRLNVAITRARRLCIVVMDALTVQSSKEQPLLKTFVDYCLSKADYRAAFSFFMSDWEWDDEDEEDLSIGIQVKDDKEPIEASESVPVSKKKMSKHERKILKKKGTTTAAEKDISINTSSPTVEEDVKSNNFRKKLLEEDIRIMLYELISREIKEDHIVFGKELNSYERRLVHEISEELGLVHKSFGEAENRQIKVALPKQNYESDMDQIVAAEIAASQQNFENDSDAEEVEEQYNQMIENYLIQETGFSLLQDDTDEKEEKEIPEIEKPTKKKKNKKKAQDSKLSEQDEDAYLDQLIKERNICAKSECKKSTALMGIVCEFCKMKYCMEHGHGAFHGCKSEVEKAAKERRKNNIKPSSSSLGETQRIYAQNQLRKKIQAESEKRKAKPKK